MNLAEILSAGAPPPRMGAVIPDGTTAAAPVTATPPPAMPLPAPTPLPPGGTGGPGIFDQLATPQAPQGPSRMDRFASIAKQLGPIIGSLAIAKKAGAPAAGAFLSGYLEQHAAHEAELQRQALVDTQAKEKLAALNDAKSKELSAWLQNLPVDASKITDPAAFASFMDIADAVGVSRYHLPKGAVTSLLGQHGPVVDKSEVTDAKELIKTIGADNLQRGLDAGAVVQFRGKQMPLREVYALSGMPTDAKGVPVYQAPQPKDTNGVSEGDFIADAVKAAESTAKAQGKMLSDADRNKIKLDARRDWAKAGHIASPSQSSVGTEGSLSADGLDYIATQYRLTRDGSILTRFSEAEKAKVINRVAEQNKTLGRTPAAAIMNQAAMKADTASLSKATTLADASFAFETKANAQADIIESLLPKVSRGSWKILNGAFAAGKVAIEGDSTESQLYNAIQTFSAEYAKIMEGSTSSASGSTEGARKTASSLINTAMPKGTLKDVLTLMRREMDLTVQGWNVTKDKIQSRMVGHGDGPALEPPRAGGPGPVDAPKIHVKLANGQTGYMSASEPLPAGAVIIK